MVNNNNNIPEFAIFNYIIKIKFEGLMYELYADDKLVTSSENYEDILNRLSDMMKKYETVKDYYDKLSNCFQHGDVYTQSKDGTWVKSGSCSMIGGNLSSVKE